MAVLYLINASYLALGVGGVGMQGTLALHLGGEGGERGDASASCEKRKTNASILISFVSFVQIIFYPIKFQIQKGQHFNLLFFVGQQLQKYWIPSAGRSWVEPNFNNSNRLAGGQPASPQIYLALAFGREGKGLECKVHWACIWWVGNPNASELAFFF